MQTVLLLVGSNIFMTCAWSGCLKCKRREGKPLFYAILASGLIACCESWLPVPASRLGFTSRRGDGYPLKVIPEVIALVVFMVFAWIVLKEKLASNPAVGCGLIFPAAFSARAVASPGRP